MATNKEFIVNKKFLIIFVSIQVVLAGLILYALLSPKTVTVQVNRSDNSFKVQELLEITPPKVNQPTNLYK